MRARHPDPAARLRYAGGRWAVAWLGAALALAMAVPAVAQPVLPKPAPEVVTYVTPWWPAFAAAGSEEAIDAEVARLRALLPDRLFARAGFSTTIQVALPGWAVDIDDREQVRSNLTSVFAAIDRAMARGRRVNLPVVLIIQTVTRPYWWSDAAHRAAEQEDRRNVQWHWDNSVATEWWTISRYARNERAFLRAHIQEIGHYLAAKAVEAPDVLVAAAGDGEVELSSMRSNAVDPTYPGPFMLADYSPFAILEFVDWIRHTGMYDDASGVWAGQGMTGLAWSYSGDLTPATDDNGDGHTFNGDFGTAFTTWRLRYFDWTLDDDPMADPRAIPGSVSEDPSWSPMPVSGPDVIEGGFDAPRYLDHDDPFWQLWNAFRQAMVHHYVTEFAEWITAGPPGVPGPRFPAARWYSYQIPADHLFGRRPGDGIIDPRLDSSASPIWTARVAPYGGVGITCFETTSAAAMPAARALDVNWGLLEYNPCQAGCPDVTWYLPDMALIEAYRPRIVAPFGWKLSFSRVDDSPFVEALAGMMASVGSIPLPATSADHFAPPQPQGVQARATDGTISLNWSALMWADEPLSAWRDWAAFDRFEIYRGHSAEFDVASAVFVGTTSSPGLIDGTLVSPGWYCYRVVAVSRTGLRSAPSSGTCTLWPSRKLRIGIGGTGSGVLMAEPGSLTCPGECERTYAGAPAVRLVPMPASGSVFGGWAGDPDCTDGIVGMHDDRTCTALFVSVLSDPPRRGLIDLNGDGGGDVLAYDRATGRWAFALGTRAGSFGEIAGSWSPAWTIRAADFNADGLTDFLYYNRTTGAWYKGINRGSGAFAYFGGSWSAGWEMWSADLDGDGRSDVFVYNVENGRWYKCFSTTEEGFEYAGGQWSPGWEVHVAELDGRAPADLFVYNDITGLWYWCLSTTREGFEYRDGYWMQRGWTLAAGDWDGDGRSDLFLYSVETGRWYVALNRGPGAGFGYIPGSWSPGWRLVVGRFDADERDDIFVYNDTNGLWYQCLSGFGPGGDFEFAYRGGRWSPGWHVEVTDFDGDGRSDIFVYNPVTGQWYQCLNTGNGTFSYGGGFWEPGLTIVASAIRLP